MKPCINVFIEKQHWGTISLTHTHWVTKGYKYLMTSLALNPSCNPLKTRWEPRLFRALASTFKAWKRWQISRSQRHSLCCRWISMNPYRLRHKGSNCHGFWTKNLPVPAPVEMVRRFQPEPRSQPIRAPALTAVLLVTGHRAWCPWHPPPHWSGKPSRRQSIPWHHWLKSLEVWKTLAVRSKSWMNGR